MPKTTPTEPGALPAQASLQAPVHSSASASPSGEGEGVPVPSSQSSSPSSAAPRRGRRRELTPAQRALALLVRREHSRPELLRKLSARGVDATEAEAAVTRMADSGWQDDGRFAVGLARMRAAGGYGPVRIEAELATHGLGAEQIAAAFQALDDDGEADWRARASALLQRRFRAAVLATDPAARRKAGDFLLRRGFAGDTLREAIRDACGR